MQGDLRQIPEVKGRSDAPSLSSLNEEIRRLWEYLYYLEGRAGPITLRDALVTLGGITSGASLTSGTSLKVNTDAVLSGAALSTSATSGFTYLPSTAGVPTGVPNVQSGTVATVYDTTNNRLGVYNNGWRQPYTPPMCRAFNSAATTTTNGVEAAIPFDSESFDTDSMHDTGVNNTRITFNTTGVYAVGGNLSWASNATGTRHLEIKLNNTTYLAVGNVLSVGASFNTRMVASTLYKFAANDYVELRVFQDSGGNLDVLADTTVLSPAFWAFKVSD
jgi:hypothetical protein